jgi:hypothetical protein
LEVYNIDGLSTGDELMERAFAQNDEVKELYKAAFAQGGHQLFGQQGKFFFNCINFI